MWAYLSDSFVSVVASPDPSCLLVRGRARGDLERAFGVPAASVTETPLADYRFRVTLPREAVAARLAEAARAIAYDNFKGSVAPVDVERHAAYLRCWEAMAAFQGLTLGAEDFAAFESYVAPKRKRRRAKKRRARPAAGVAEALG